ncbi:MULTISPECIES: hypothetical protein [Burkholderiaceae]|uniref:hypothetical protein n=1 Tax=Burkholderiaceae TaxID=119060 RepID=UPI000961D66F|nr:MULTISPECIES: hypothetical protein [Burkholderiaceae]MCG1018930.1 hypothetical protein [Mycetohabitans sp. B4]SIT74104.1 hypothetical protein SAMN04487768_2945 [Burkholderia sp. b13]
MTNRSNSPEQQQTSGENDSDTFTTDVSETDDQGTTVREAEVRKDDLSEVVPGKPADEQ